MRDIQSEQKTLDVSEAIISDKSLTKLKRILNPGGEVAHREDKAPALYLGKDASDDLDLYFLYTHPMHYQHIQKCCRQLFDYSSDWNTLTKTANGFLAILFDVDEKALQDMRRGDEANASICKAILMDIFFQNLIVLARHSINIFLQNSLIRAVIPLIALTNENLETYQVSKPKMLYARYRAAQIIFELNKLMPELRQFIGHHLYYRLIKGAHAELYPPTVDDDKFLPTIINQQEKQEKLEMPDERGSGIDTIIKHLIYITCPSFEYEAYVKRYASSARLTNVGILIHGAGGEENEQFYYRSPTLGTSQIQYHAKSIAKIRQQLAENPRISWEFYLDDIQDIPAKKRLTQYMRFIEKRWHDQPNARFSPIMVILTLKELGIIDAIMPPPDNYNEWYTLQANHIYYQFTRHYLMSPSLTSLGIEPSDDIELGYLYSKALIASCFDEYHFLKEQGPLLKGKKVISSQIKSVFFPDSRAWPNDPRQYFLPIFELIRHPDKCEIIQYIAPLNSLTPKIADKHDKFDSYIFSLLIKENQRQEMDEDGLFEIQDYSTWTEENSLQRLSSALKKKKYKDLWFFINETKETIKFKNASSLYGYLKYIAIILNISPDAIQAKRLLIFIVDLLNQITFKWMSKKITIPADNIQLKLAKNIAIILEIIIRYLNNVPKPIILMARNYITFNLRLSHHFFIKENREERSPRIKQAYIKAIKLFTQLSCRLNNDIPSDFALLLELFGELQCSTLSSNTKIEEYEKNILNMTVNCLILFIKTVYSSENGEKRCESLKQIFTANQPTLKYENSTMKYLNARIRFFLQDPHQPFQKSLPAPLLLEIPDSKLTLPQVAASPSTPPIALSPVGTVEESSVRVSIPRVSSTIFHHPLTELSLAKEPINGLQTPSAPGMEQ